MWILTFACGLAFGLAFGLTARRLGLRRSQIAGLVNVSATYFSELFKKGTGMNFVEYVARVRVQKAKNILQNPNKRISEVAFDVGFQSLSQFNRRFKKITGRSPSDYRGQCWFLTIRGAAARPSAKSRTTESHHAGIKIAFLPADPKKCAAFP